MNKICTTYEQSKELIELGIDVKTADMIYNLVVNEIGQLSPESVPFLKEVYDKGIIYTLAERKTIPCWSLSTLLELLPAATLDTSDNHGYRMYCCYHFTEWYDTAIDAAVAMIKKLKEQNEL